MSSLTLPDIASQHAPASTALDWVGMEHIALPVVLGGQRLSAYVDAGVSLDEASAKGIHMSRLYLALATLTQRETDTHALHELLTCFLDSHRDLSQHASLSIHTELPLKQPALVSPLAGWKLYPVRILADMRVDQKVPMIRVELEVAYSSTCPCSAALARQLIQQQFDNDFSAESIRAQDVRAWLGGSAGIVATPHSQRSTAHLNLTLSAGTGLSITDWIATAEQALGTALQTAVKRADEQAFALANGQNLMFCEDAARRLHQAFRQRDDLQAFDIRVVHAESLHAHDAVARSSWRRPEAA